MGAAAFFVGFLRDGAAVLVAAPVSGAGFLTVVLGLVVLDLGVVALGRLGATARREPALAAGFARLRAADFPAARPVVRRAAVLTLAERVVGREAFRAGDLRLAMTDFLGKGSRAA